MTAPDPGLTDLIAAHYRHCVSEEIRLDPETGIHTKWIECTCVCGADTSVEVTGDREAAVRLADAEHVALVVKQHIARRIAELEASTRESVRVLVMERHRAEKAEATIARVEKALAEGPLHRIDFPRSKDPYGIERQMIRAALEGES